VCGSLLVHAVAITLLVGAAGSGRKDDLVGNPSLVVLPVAFVTSAPRPPAPPPSPGADRVITKHQAIAPAPAGFQTVVAPLDIPPLPPIDFNERPFDPRDYTGRGVEGGTHDGVFGAIRTVRRGRPGGGEEVVYTTDTDDFRFQAAVLISQPEPRYPTILQQVGVEGHVLLRFVVDTTGRVDKGSIEVVEASDEQFIRPARESVIRARFRPALMSGSPVRQLAEQSMRFAIRY
jgi:TonB family protein